MWWAWDGYNRDQEAKESPVPLLEEWGILLTPEQQKKLLKAKIAVALQDELGRAVNYRSTEMLVTICIL
jgi:hypothetical protein